MASLKEREWSCYRGGQVEGEWSCYRDGHFKRENGHVTEVNTLMKGEWSYDRGGQFKDVRMVILRRSL